MKKRLLFLFIVFLGLSAWYFADKIIYTLRSLTRLVSQSPAKAAKLHAEGLRLFNQGKFKEAIDAWLQELKLDPQNADSCNNIGMAYKNIGDYANSIQYHKKAIELAPNFGHGYYSLGIAYFESKSYDEAVKAFQKSRSSDFPMGR